MVTAMCLSSPRRLNYKMTHELDHPIWVVQTEDCVEAHTNVDIVVNLDELRALLRSRLPLVYNSASVKAAMAPWPSI